MIGQTIAHYHITAKLGAGGMGEVYLAEDLKLGRKVAIKLLSTEKSSDEDSRKRFIHEARAQAMLNHPNIATFHEVDEADGRVFIVMEYVEGKPLPDYVRSARLSVEEVLDLVIQIGEGLQAAHEKGVIHRDIKPENVMVTSKGHVKITDFGLARWKGATTLTKSGTRLGTAYYMSPEQAEGRRVDHRTDIFSLGVVLYEMLCHQRPFEGEAEPVILYELTTKSPAPLARYCRDATEGMERIVSKCLAKNPEERYQSCADLVRDLRVEQKAEHADGGPPSPPITRHRRGLVISASAVAVIALLLLIFKPWNIELSPTKEAGAVENRLAVMYFHNLVDPDDGDRMGEIAANLVMSDLSTSDYLQVVSSQRLYDVLKLLGKEGIKKIDRETAAQVAKKTHARWMLTGSILRLEPSIVLNAQLVDVESGSIIASPTVTGVPDEDIFRAVDSLTWQIKEHLSLPEESLAEENYAVSSLTTSSADAYRHYLQGWDYYYKLKYTQAALEFSEAVKADSTFAMAYYSLSFVALYLPEKHPRVEETMIDRARSLQGRLSKTDQLRILARSASVKGDSTAAISYLEKIIESNPDDKFALYELGYIRVDWGNEEAAIPAYLRVIEIDPQFKLAHNNLAYCYEELGDLENSLSHLNWYLELAPDEPNPYDSRGELYGRMGRLNDAIASYQKALEKDALFENSLDALVCMYLNSLDFDSAESVIARELTHPDPSARDDGRWNRMYMSFYLGKLNEAFQRATHASETDIMEYGSAYNMWRHLKQMVFTYDYILLLTGASQWQDSLEAHLVRLSVAFAQDSTASNYDSARVYFDWAVFAAQSGDQDCVDSNLTMIYELLDMSDNGDRAWYAMNRAVVEYAMGKYDSAIVHYTQYCCPEDRPQSQYSYTTAFWLGRAHLMAGDVGKAVELLEIAARQFDVSRCWSGLTTPRLHYYLGRAYEESGWSKKAIAQYEAMATIWKDADERILELEDAKMRLAKLKDQVGYGS